MSSKAFLSKLSIAFHYVFLRFRVFGNNKLLIGTEALFWKNRFRITGENNTILLGKNIKLKNTKISINGNNNKIVLSDYVEIKDSCEFLIEGNDCEIFLGRKTSMGTGKFFCGESKTSIKVGENCMLSRGGIMSTSDFHSIIDLSTELRTNRPGNIIIKNNVWIASNVTIKKGAVIEENSVVGASSIVIGKTYPSNVILAGHPAKIIKENITWSREKLPY